ncbi:gustatory and odorant receptor 21a-like [Neodiprion fabricii]|uniref:gustatory and odorant receptor 21a-like n=1 Tax=Neodiprion fabricii TaxID=2872261 RepID=UPI001ED96764|nr:gustatory and odorant receptor 21a-like [Neodiprion fabricii]
MDFRTVCRPMILALRVSGTFFISVKRDGYTFSWFSVETIYAILFHVVTDVVAAISITPKIKELLESGFDLGLDSFFTLALTWPNFVLPIIGLFSSKSVTRYLNEWKIVEDEFRALAGKSLVFPELKTASRLLPIVTSILPIPVTVIAISIGRHSIIQAITNAKPLLTFDCVATMWQIQAELFSLTYQKYCENLSKTLHSTQGTNASVIVRYRLLYLRITSLALSLNRSMNLMTTIAYVILYIDMIIGAYSAIVGLSSKVVTASLLYQLFFPLLYCTIINQVYCEAGRRITLAGGEEVAGKISGMRSRFSWAARTEFFRLMDTVYLLSPEPRLAGCVRLGRGLTTVSLKIMFSYLVVLFQFRGSLE